MAFGKKTDRAGLQAVLELKNVDYSKDPEIQQLYTRLVNGRSQFGQILAKNASASLQIAEVVDALKDYDSMAFIITNTSNEIKNTHDKMCAIRSPQFDGMPRTHNPQAGEESILKGIEDIDVLQERYRQAVYADKGYAAGIKKAATANCSGFSGPGPNADYAAATAALLTRWGSFSLMRADLPLRSRR